jgi:hypothetical protein
MDHAAEYINRDIEGIKKDLALLNKLVVHGNGQPSLILQVSDISTRVEQVEVSLATGIADLKDSIKDYHLENAEKGKMSLSFKTAIVVALIGSLTSLALNYQSANRPPTVNVDDYVVAQQTLNRKLDKLLAHEEANQINGLKDAHKALSDQTK